MSRGCKNNDTISHNHRLSRWLAQPYKGMLPAEPIGTSNNPSFAIVATPPQTWHQLSLPPRGAGFPETSVCEFWGFQGAGFPETSVCEFLGVPRRGVPKNERMRVLGVPVNVAPYGVSGNRRFGSTRRGDDEIIPVGTDVLDRPQETI